MNVDKQLAFHRLGIYSLGDLIRYDPFHYARLIVMIADGELQPEAVPLRHFVTFNYERMTAEDLVDTTLEALEGIGPAYARLFAQVFGVKTIRELAAFELLQAAEEFLTSIEL